MKREHNYFSSFFSDPLGRRLSMILVNIPYLIGWFTLYQATSVVEVFIGFVMLGLAVGLMEAPVAVHVGEIWYERSISGNDFRAFYLCETFSFILSAFTTPVSHRRVVF